MKSLTAAAFFAAVSLLSGVAHAQSIVDTGTPTGSASNVLYPAQSLAAEFSIQAGQTITSIAPYLNQGTAQPGDFFTLDIYSVLPASHSNGTEVYSVSGQWETNGFTTVTANWTAPSTGDYWLAVTQPTTGYQFSVPTLATATTGNVPALGFAYSGSSGKYTTSSATSFGLEIQATAAPEPSAWALGLVCVGGFAALRMRRLLGR